MGLSYQNHTIRAVLCFMARINHPEKTWRSLANHLTPSGVVVVCYISWIILAGHHVKVRQLPQGVLHPQVSRILCPTWKKVWVR